MRLVFVLALIPAMAWGQYYVTSPSAAAPPVADSVQLGTITEFTGGTTDYIAFQHTVGEETDRLLVVDAAGVTASDYNYAVDSIKWGDQSLTNLWRATAWSTQAKAERWYLVAPTSGTDSIRIWWEEAISDRPAAAMNFYNVDQETPLGSVTDYNKVTGDAPSLTVESGGPTEMVIDLWYVRVAGSTTGTMGENQAELAGNLKDSNLLLLSSYERGTGTITMSWTLNESKDHEGCGVAILPH